MAQRVLVIEIVLLVSPAMAAASSVPLCATTAETRGSSGWVFVDGSEWFVLFWWWGSLAAALTHRERRGRTSASLVKRHLVSRLIPNRVWLPSRSGNRRRLSLATDRRSYVSTLQRRGPLRTARPFGRFGQSGQLSRPSGPGAVIQVAGGEYEESIAIESLTGLRIVGGFVPSRDFSSRDPEVNETILRGAPEHAVVSIAASTDILIEGFRITGGGGFFDGYKVAGGGVFIDEESAVVTIVANRVYGNAVDRGPEPERAEGGGIASYGADVKIIGNVVEANRGGRGAGIASEGGVIDSNVVVDNVAVGDHGGGIAATGQITIMRNRVEGNSVGTVLGYGYGGGIFVFGSEGRGVLQGNVVTGNVAVSYGSGVFIDDGAHASLFGELYFANKCTKEGAVGLFIDSGGPTSTVVSVDNSTITEHDCADSAQGGNAVYVNRSDDDPAPVVTITNSILWSNGGSDLLNVASDVTVTWTLSEDDLDGDGNTSSDPQFTDPLSGDFRLGPASPARGAREDGGDLGYTGVSAGES